MRTQSGIQHTKILKNNKNMPGHWHRTSNNKNVIGDWEIYIKDKC